MPRYSPHLEITKKRIGDAQRGVPKPRRHGHATAINGRSKTYLCWSSMKRRCLNPTEAAYHNYGGRGIKVCKRWLKFENFLADMGEQPKGKQLERRDNDGNYTPSNCCWSTKKEQANNRRTNHFLVFQGVSKTVTAWAEELGLNPTTVAVRLYRGCSAEEALRPVRKWDGRTV